MAWRRYSGHELMRQFGYGVRHIWGNTHNPNAFTAGWNLCYMPFWAGYADRGTAPPPRNCSMQSVKHLGDLFFADTPVCTPPDFVSNPGLDLDTLLDGNPLLILSRESHSAVPQAARKNQQGPTLPITLEPPNSEDFLARATTNE